MSDRVLIYKTITTGQPENKTRFRYEVNKYKINNTSISRYMVFPKLSEK